MIDEEKRNREDIQETGFKCPFYRTPIWMVVGKREEDIEGSF